MWCIMGQMDTFGIPAHIMFLESYEAVKVQIRQYKLKPFMNSLCGRVKFENRVFILPGLSEMRTATERW